MEKDEEKDPWTTLSSELVHETPWISVTKHDVLTPGGNPGNYSTVHFKNLAIGIVPLDENLNTWIVGQYRYPIKEYSWEIPEGGGSLNIDPLESAQRELSEETGITANKWILIQEMHLSNSVSDEYCYLFIAQNLSFGESHPDDTEELIIRKLPFKDLYQMVLEGKIKDSMTVTAVLKTQLLIKEGKI